jgi:hypothetical protein
MFGCVLFGVRARWFPWPFTAVTVDVLLVIAAVVFVAVVLFAVVRMVIVGFLNRQDTD